MPSSQNKKNTPESSFEKDIAKLEKIITKLEEGELSLGESLKEFEQGMNLLKNCQQVLSQAEQKVNILIKKHHDFQIEDFEEHRKK